MLLVMYAFQEDDLGVILFFHCMRIYAYYAGELDLIILIRSFGIKLQMPALKWKMARNFWGNPMNLTLS